MNANTPTSTRPVFDEPFLKRALTAARLLHNRYTPRRKEDNEPYITHPQAIVSLLRAVGCREPITLADAICHDLFDNTKVTPKQLTRLLAGHDGRYQETAARVVKGVLQLSDEASLTDSEKEQIATLSRTEKRVWKTDRQILIFLNEMDDLARPARMGDIIHNAATMSNGTQELRAETHRKGKAIFRKENWNGKQETALLATIFYMNISGHNDDLIGPYGVRAPMPFAAAIPEMVHRAHKFFSLMGYPDLSIAPDVLLHSAPERHDGQRPGFHPDGQQPIL